ncbi:MAG TPA: glycoside hydrolase family 15 protein [Candidatus Eisenbacteria bacterium]|nr:glycoside hydrolase family 15 protein [Candidatus Eisenbacteria bacterium]
MALLPPTRRAFGQPGIAPRWTRSAKDAVGTAASAASRVWFTMSRGVLNEVYYPTVDRPQIRDLQYLITDGGTFFHDERRHLSSTTEYIDDHSQGVRVMSVDAEGRYRLEKEIVTNPQQACVLIWTKVTALDRPLETLRLFALLAPHLDGGGGGNSGYVAVQGGHEALVAQKGGVWLALAATIPFRRRSCGYVGRSDGWTDLAENFEMDWEFDAAPYGNIALTGELDLNRGHEFVLGLAFGESLHNALTSLYQSLGFPFAEHKKRFVKQWANTCRTIEPLAAVSTDGGRLYRTSHSLLIAHEDKTYPGATIASLSIPWGEVKGDEDLGGYHLVWTRDMVHSALGLLASGDTDRPLRSLIYLACTQRPDGGFYQNFWIDGDPYWQGVQVDEVAFPILLAWRLRAAGALRDFDPYPMVVGAAAWLIRQGPITPQERWEENSGYSPSTLAASIAALTCAADFAADRGDSDTAQFFHEYADFLECHVDAWTVTTAGILVPGISRHFIRLHPAVPGDPEPDEDPDHGLLQVRNRPPGEPFEFPAKDVVDAGFLELVRYGIRKFDDPLIEDSVRVVDAVLKVNTPAGPCWHRYNHDGYGQRENGGPYAGWGKGRAWPLLTGERGHYELAAGRDAGTYIKAIEGFASATGLLPEQVWDEPDRPEYFMYLGRPTGSAMPLMWAHAEYIKLLRSARDGAVFDRIPLVSARYQGLGRPARRPIEVWAFNRRIRTVRPGWTLRLQAEAPFRLHWSDDEWHHVQETPSRNTAAGIDFVNLPIAPAQQAPLRFTFFWTNPGRWEGHDFTVAME